MTSLWYEWITTVEKSRFSLNIAFVEENTDIIVRNGPSIRANMTQIFGCWSTTVITFSAFVA